MVVTLSQFYLLLAVRQDLSKSIESSTCLVLTTAGPVGGTLTH